MNTTTHAASGHPAAGEGGPAATSGGILSTGAEAGDGPALIGVPWPNVASPGLSPFHIEVPAGWTAIETPGALIAFLGPESGGFRPNVVVFGERLPQEVTLAEAAEAVLWDTGADSATGPLADEDFPFHAIREAVIGVDGMELRELAVATEADDLSSGGLRSVFTLLATHLVARTAADEPVVVDILASFACERAPAGKDGARTVKD